MGYEIAGGLGLKMAAPDREVFVMVGDGSYLMMAQELVTAVPGNQARRRPDHNHGFAVIGALSETVGAQRFGTWFRSATAVRAGSTATSCRSTSRPTRRAWARRAADAHDR